jgi:hypothetical protein
VAMVDEETVTKFYHQEVVRKVLDRDFGYLQIPPNPSFF